MKSIKLFGVREEDIPFINEWSEKNQVLVDLDSDILSLETVDRVKGFDGVSLSQQIELDETVYKKLHDYGIKQIAQRSAGFDSYNLELAKQYELVITNVPSYSPNSIAEYTVSQALNLIRNFNDIQNKTTTYDFRWQPSILSRSIKDLKVAVIGTGRIGSIVGKIFAEGFGSEVVAYDIEPQISCEAYLTYQESMSEAIKDADIVTVHIPATKDNTYLFNETVFTEMKTGAVFINCARGTIVDTKALIDALNSGKLKGAALDTYEGEKGLFPSDQRNTQLDDAVLVELIERQDVILSPHIAFYTDAAVKNLIVDALDATLEVIYTGDSKLRVN
ncbi:MULTISPECIES: D-lactate dehydrogenase [Staphylococcus]|uniref:D-lactate dehydrogenase n=1 Tax=Staphylococcus TaxID=1279 RepID=UPI00085CDEDC|nr:MULTISPECIES: D-lactate dehydrogenase [Staphylococcus]PTG49102.1 lactate dehydrogenase [Staphylococcus cohnii]SCS25755.1 D-lactate dehydrogenase [Staphylococcus cohnii subsp. cohnii]MDQ7111362.1 D-lactate dehydrogenase [Staphylococcus ureilyticus]MDU9348277.1 D-lactate dehydrogenase [Staphylococcus ureilyticus]QQV53303.1 D-lactate dehydrogenase [Staphylococcus sp. 11-B-312]